MLQIYKVLIGFILFKIKTHLLLTNDSISIGRINYAYNYIYTTLHSPFILYLHSRSIVAFIIMVAQLYFIVSFDLESMILL